MKKILTIIFSVFSVLVVLGACSSSNQESNNEVSTGNSADGEQTEINALFMQQAGYSEEEISLATKQFEEENPNTKVNITFVAYEALEQRIQTSAKTGGYDVVVIDAPWTAKFAKAGLVMDVSDRLAEVDVDDIFEGAIDSVTFDNKAYGMPWLNDTKFLFYNKQMLAEAGFENPPETWEELMEQATELKKQGIVEYPLVWSWAQAEALVCDLVVLTSSFGGDLVDENGVPTATDEQNLEALNFMVNSIDDGISNPNSTEYLEEDVRGVFSSGNAAFSINWTYAYNMANDESESSVAGDVGISPIPGGASYDGMSVNGGMGLSITSGSKHADEAWNYIEHLSSKEFQQKNHENALPIWVSLYSEPQIIETNPEVVQASEVQYGFIENRPRVPWYGEFSTNMQVSIQEALLGSSTPEEALQSIQSHAEGLAGN